MRKTGDVEALMKESGEAFTHLEPLRGFLQSTQGTIPEDPCAQYHCVCSILKDFNTWYRPFDESSEECFNGLDKPHPPLPSFPKNNWRLFLSESTETFWLWGVPSPVLCRQLQLFLEAITSSRTYPVGKGLIPGGFYSLLSKLEKTSTYLSKHDRDVLSAILRTYMKPRELESKASVVDYSEMKTSEGVEAEAEVGSELKQTSQTPSEDSLKELRCPMTQALPLFPVRIGSCNQAYERLELTKFLQQKKDEQCVTTWDPVQECEITLEDFEGQLEPHVEHEQKVKKWVMEHYDAAEAKEWLIGHCYAMSGKELLEVCRSPLKLPREEKRTLKLGSVEGVIEILRDGCYAVSYEPCLSGLDEHLSIMKESCRGIKWCSILRGADDGELCLVVCIYDIENSMLRDPVVEYWEMHGILSRLKLRIIDVKPGRTPAHANVNPSRWKRALKWWLHHQEETTALFMNHSKLSAVFLDHPLRAGKYDTSEMALVVVVQCKGFIPPNEKPVPHCIGRIRTDVRSGTAQLVHSAHDHAIHPQGKPYLGVSIGRRGKSAVSGTLGPILTSGEATFGLTAHHVVSSSNTMDVEEGCVLLAPKEWRFKIKGIERKELKFKCGVYYEDVTLDIDGEAIKVSIDAALLESDSGYAPRNVIGDKYYKVCHQNGEIVSLKETFEEALHLVFFGRTSGPRGFDNDNPEFFTRSIGHFRPEEPSEGHIAPEVPANAIEPSGGPRPTRNGKTFLNQLMFASSDNRSATKEGDSGSALWHLTESSTLSCIGLVIAKVAKFAFATPIEAVLKFFTEKHNLNLTVAAYSEESDGESTSEQQ